MDDKLSGALSALLADIEDEKDPKALASTLLALTHFKKLLGDVIDEAQAKLYQAMDKKEMDLGAGIGVVQRNKDTTVKWNHEALFDEFVKRNRVVDESTGEVTVDGTALATQIRDAVAFSYWRKQVLRGMKIDPADYSHTAYGRPRIRFLSKVEP